MAIREIITVPDPLLKTVSKEVDNIDDEILNILDDMLETMYAAPGIGLAAIQIGIPKRMLVIDISRDEENKDPHIFINPEILDPAENLSTFEEGCLSVPGTYAKVDRHDTCTVKALDRHGKEFTIDASELQSICIQHELDHLNGVLFVDYLLKSLIYLRL